MNSFRMALAGSFTIMTLGACTPESHRNDEFVGTTPKHTVTPRTTADTVAEHDAWKMAEVAREEPSSVHLVKCDNSKLNRTEGVAAATTADDHRNAEDDLELTRSIRRSLTEDESLSTYAHNVKIIAQDGKVMLKGPVRSASERSVVEERARRYAPVKRMLRASLPSFHGKPSYSSL